MTRHFSHAFDNTRFIVIMILALSIKCPHLPTWCTLCLVLLANRSTYLRYYPLTLEFMQIIWLWQQGFVDWFQRVRNRLFFLMASKSLDIFECYIKFHWPQIIEVTQFYSRHSIKVLMQLYRCALAPIADMRNSASQQKHGGPTLLFKRPFVATVSPNQSVSKGPWKWTIYSLKRNENLSITFHDSRPERRATSNSRFHNINLVPVSTHSNLVSTHTHATRLTQNETRDINFQFGTNTKPLVVRTHSAAWPQLHLLLDNAGTGSRDKRETRVEEAWGVKNKARRSWKTRVLFSGKTEIFLFVQFVLPAY